MLAAQDAAEILAGVATDELVNDCATGASGCIPQAQLGCRIFAAKEAKFSV